MPGDTIQMKSLPNLRDLGGYESDSGGTVRPGVLYRSAALCDLDEADATALASYGIKTVFDLRSAEERDSHPDRLPEGARAVHAEVLDGSADAAHANREVVSRPSALKAYRSYFLEVTEDANRPALIHCAGGATRTGWAAAATLMLLGVSDEDVRDEYMAVKGAESKHLDAALDEMRKQYGSIESYFTVGLGIGPAGREELRTALLA